MNSTMGKSNKDNKGAASLTEVLPLDINKVVGRTFGHVILCLFHQQVQQMDRRSLYVAISRVKQIDNIQLPTTIIEGNSHGQNADPFS